MSTLLQNGVAPVWFWILIIIIGSIFVISLLTYLTQRCIRSRRKASGVDIEANGFPTRRLTVRKGKVVANQETSERSRLLHDHVRPGSHGSHGQEIDLWRVKEKGLSDSPSTFESSETSPAALRYSTAPRLSLGAFDDRDAFDGFKSVSDLSIISKPSSAVINESRKKAINFSRPQFRAPSQQPVTKKNRLSVINEATPRNSFIGRIVSWASFSNDSESRTPQLHGVVAEKGSVINQDFIESKEDLTPKPSPMSNSLREIQRLSEASTPELPSKHPSRITNTSDDMATLLGSRASSVTGSPYRHSHQRSNSGTHLLRKGTYSSHSRSSSITNFSRPQQPMVDHSRSNSDISAFEEPQATLSGPFDALEAMMSRESVSSIYSENSYHVNAIRAESRAAPKPPSPDVETSTINTDILLSGRSSTTPSTSSLTGARWKHRSRSRGPSITANSSGQTVLRKRSLQPIQITMIGPVDPASLENLSIVELS